VELDKKRGCVKVRRLRRVRGKMSAETADYQTIAGNTRGACLTVCRRYLFTISKKRFDNSIEIVG
jgi:hypothetical protein